MNKLKNFEEFTNESLLDFIEYGNFNVSKKLKDQTIKDLETLSVSNDDVHLTGNGLILKTKSSEVEVNTKFNYISLNGSKIFLTKNSILKLYNDILKNSFS